ncbi:UDP-glucose 4-epimerase GalE [Catalinimonas niigatensis]|uniref:UDP-glucose 4-epimerase GalE n=1 Tax=Catalinimonas niigatensis TaxID=1397264 RepID=UPI002665DAD7|nr:UDP-glucose 4-epimerase GalE [Catalinimonas niigatensis]WPP53487.1 UDP-glucose 4-epimerase GalE [Catalinimonas niigatensis]
MPDQTSKVIVTGGAGYIGSHTVVELFHAGYEPIIIDNFVNAEKSAVKGIENILGHKVKLYEGDCGNMDFMRNVIRQEKNVSGIIHFAAYKAVGESVAQPLKYYRNNIDTLLSLLELMHEQTISRLVFSSSCTVYGQPDALPVTEQSPKKPAESPYGNTKQICEEIMEDTVKSGMAIKTVALRYFNPIGAHESAEIGELPLGVPNNLVPFVTQTAAGIREKLTVFGNDYNTHDGTCLRDYIHVVDLAKAHVSALHYLERKSEKSSYDVFNIGTGKGSTVLDVIKTFEEVNQVKLNYTIGPRRPGDVEKVYAEVSQANAALRWKAQLSLADALKDSWRWQLKLKKKSKQLP